MLRNTHQEYGLVTKTFHWVIFLLLLFMIIYGFLLPSIPKPYQAFAYNLHKQTGLTILLLMILRLFWSLANPKPKLPQNTPNWQAVLERVVHWLLYIVIIAMPLAGWIGSSAVGKGPHFFGVALNLPIPANKQLSEICFQIHNTVAIIIIVLVSVHVLAALYHYFIKRDQVLQRMLP